MEASEVKRVRDWMIAALWVTLLAGAPGTGQAAVMDFLFGKKVDSGPSPNQRSWKIAEFTAIRLVPREAGSAPNRHPVRVQPELLRQQLALTRAQLRGGETPLFFPDELADLVEPLTQALSLAGPDDDIVLLSTARRDAGVLGTPLGITARLFVQGDALNLIVHDARRDFVNAYIGSRIPPTFTFGSRSEPGATSIKTVSGASRRADWVALPLAAMTGSAMVPGAVPADGNVQKVAVPAAPAAPAVAAPAPTGAAKLAPTEPPSDRDASGAGEIERRLTVLKRLRDKGLISEEEYQQKRKEILRSL